MKPHATVRGSRFMFFLALMWMTLAAGACTRVPIVCHPNYFHAMDQETVAEEIRRLETVLDRKPGDTFPCFYLALLHAHPNNPSTDYRRSLQMFEKHIQAEPHSCKNDEALYLADILKELTESRDKQAVCQNEAEHLTSQNAKLILENKNLHGAIERLKLLELQLEEKRQIFK